MEQDCQFICKKLYNWQNKLIAGAHTHIHTHAELAFSLGFFSNRNININIRFAISLYELSTHIIQRGQVQFSLPGDTTLKYQVQNIATNNFLIVTRELWAKHSRLGFFFLLYFHHNDSIWLVVNNCGCSWHQPLNFPPCLPESKWENREG